MKFKLTQTLGTTAILAGAIAAAVAAPQQGKANPLRVSMMSLGAGNVRVISGGADV